MWVMAISYVKQSEFLTRLTQYLPSPLRRGHGAVKTAALGQPRQPGCRVRPPYQHLPPRLLQQPAPLGLHLAEAWIACRQATDYFPEIPAVGVEARLGLPVAPLCNQGPQKVRRASQFRFRRAH